MTTAHDNTAEFIKKTDPSFGKVFLEGDLFNPRNVLSSAARQELLLLEPFESLIFHDKPDHPSNKEESGRGYLHRIQQSILGFMRGRPDKKVVTRKSVDEETGQSILIVIRKPNEEDDQ